MPLFDDDTLPPYTPLEIGCLIVCAAALVGFLIKLAFVWFGG